MSGLSTLTYSHRHAVLSNLLNKQQTELGSSRFYIPSTLVISQDARSSILDDILLRGWCESYNRSGQELWHQVSDLRISQNDFQTIGRLGEGQFGVVEAVRCKLNGQVYAMKKMQKHAMTRAGPQISLAIERHIHILSHSSTISPIPKLMFAFQSQDIISLVTTYARCGSLWDRLCYLSNEDDQAGRMTDPEIKWWAPQMASAIQWLHEQGYAHRDIKPHNFLITDDSRLLLTDFGSAAQLHYTGSSHMEFLVARDQCFLPVGTPDYIAPEVLQLAEAALVQAEAGPDPTQDALEFGYSSSVDWWSFGASLYEMATGKGPFWAPTIQQTYSLLVQYQGDLPKSTLLSGDLRQLLRRFYPLDRANIAVPQPPDFEKLEPIDLQSLALTNEGLSNTSEFTFNHLFDQSEDSDSTGTSKMDSSGKIYDLTTASRWIGWTWEPSPTLLQSDKSAAEWADPDPQLTQSWSNYATPVRPRSHHAHTQEATSTARRPIPGSHARSRPVSERQAFVELLQCVQKSAKKQVSEQRGRPWYNDHGTANHAVPPTPTPLSRDTSKSCESKRHPRTDTKIRDRLSTRIAVTPTVTISTIEKHHLSLTTQLNNLDRRLRTLRRVLTNDSENQ